MSAARRQLADALDVERHTPQPRHPWPDMPPVRRRETSSFPQPAERQKSGLSTGREGSARDPSTDLTSTFHSEWQLSTGPVDAPVGNPGRHGDAWYMSLCDGCPECATNVEPPRSVVAVMGAHRATYECADCGHTWTTDWKD